MLSGIRAIKTVLTISILGLLFILKTTSVGAFGHGDGPELLPAADLLLENVSVEIPSNLSNWRYVSFKVKNSGLVASRLTLVEIDIRRPIIPTGFGGFFGPVRYIIVPYFRFIPALSAGATYQPSRVLVGKCGPLVTGWTIVDPGNIVPELSESNNLVNFSLPCL